MWQIRSVLKHYKVPEYCDQDCRLAVTGILLSTSMTLVFRATFVSRLGTTGILLSISLAFVLTAAVTGKVVTLGILFSVSVISVL